MLWGIVAACGWGTADFIARGVSVRLSAYRALLYAHLVSFGCLLPIVLASAPTGAGFAMLALGALLGASNTLGSLLLYRSLSVGRLSIVSPIGSSFAAVTLLLSLLSGDTISAAKIGGLVLTTVGVIFASMAGADETDATGSAVRGVPAALGAALAFGVTFWGLKFVVPTLGPWLPVFESRVTTLLLLPLLARPLGESIAPPPARSWPLVVAIGLIDTCANAAYNVGIRSDAPGVVAVLGSLFSPITVLLAFVLLRERLSPRQWLGVGLIFCSVMAIGIAENFVLA